MPLMQWEVLRPWLLNRGVTILAGVNYQEVIEKGLLLTDAEGTVRLIPADSVLVALPLQPNMGLYDSLLGRVPEVHVIGDAGRPGLIMDAIAAGFELGREI